MGYRTMSEKTLYFCILLILALLTRSKLVFLIVLIFVALPQVVMAQPIIIPTVIKGQDGVQTSMNLSLEYIRELARNASLRNRDLIPNVANVST
jgi:hypothetical protein